MKHVFTREKYGRSDLLSFLTSSHTFLLSSHSPRLLLPFSSSPTLILFYSPPILLSSFSTLLPFSYSHPFRLSSHSPPPLSLSLFFPFPKTSCRLAIELSDFFVKNQDFYVVSIAGFNVSPPSLIVNVDLFVFWHCRRRIHSII